MNSNNNSNLSSPNPSLQSKSLCSAKSFASHFTNDTNYSTTSAITTSATTVHSKGYANVKCKALHHACHKLNSVHNQIRHLIQDEWKEYLESAFDDGDIVPPMQSSSSLSNPTKNASTTTDTAAATAATPLSPSCHLVSGSSFDEFGDVPSIAEQLSPTLGKVMNCIYSPSSSTEQYTNNSSTEWDDPWIEACKAILTILEIYPEAARERESRHGCLPLHLAVFAMRPTPNATLPNQYKKFKYGRHGNCNSFFASSFRATASCLDGQQHQSHKEQIQAASNLQDYTSHTNNGANNTNLPPRPLQLLRGRSNSSAASFASGRSLGGFSTVLMDGGGCSLGATSTISDKVSQELTDSMLTLEEKLRLHQSSSGTAATADPNFGVLDYKGLTENEVRLLEKCTRPTPMSSNLDRGSSVGSTYSNCSQSIVSNCSTVMPLELSMSMEPSMSMSKSQEEKEFYLDKYIANAKRREEYSIKVIHALLSVYKRASATDSEGGRLPLHTAVAGRATHKVIDTIVRSYPHAARNRTKDGSLPLHIAASCGVSDAEVAPTLLRHYPYATVGKNRYERTPLQEASLQAGENGREYQIELLIALRRPPFYWQSPRQSDMINSPIETLGSGSRR